MKLIMLFGFEGVRESQVADVRRSFHQMYTVMTILSTHYFQEFEKLSSRKLRINAKEAMKIAEKLYTQG